MPNECFVFEFFLSLRIVFCPKKTKRIRLLIKPIKMITKYGIWCHRAPIHFMI
jgi:hypothetical protein